MKQSAQRLKIPKNFPRLYVSGMASNGVSGGFRMGPIFGGMLLSGKKVADLIAQQLNND
jgi:thiamine thiazole synthase